MINTTSRLAALFVVVMLNISLGACSTLGSAGSVTILGPWTGAEEVAFRKVLAKFEEDTGIGFDYKGTRALNEVLSSDVQQGTQRDIAILFSPGELAQYVPRGEPKRGELHPLDDMIEPSRAAYPEQWLELQKLGTDKLYGVVIKANLKSIVWFNPDHFPDSEPEPMPGTWDEFVDLGQRLAGPEGTPWCMGMGSTPTSGWPGTDWIEDILLHQSGTDVYRQWVHGELSWESPEVRQAWETWGTITARTESRSTLLTDFQDAGRPLFANPPRCFLNHQPSFIMNSYQGFQYQKGTGVTPEPVTGFGFFPFPEFGSQSGDPTGKAYAVSADSAVMFNNTLQAQELIRYLAKDEAQRIWPEIPGAGAFSVNKNVELSVYGDGVSQSIARILTTAGTLCYDAADFMPASMRNAFYRAVMEYLSDPTQLDSLLAELDRVRNGVAPEEWLNFPCGQ